MTRPTSRSIPWKRLVTGTRIIQAIGKDYEVHLPSLYPYLMLALSNQQTRRTLLEAPAAKGDSDIVLARRLIQLMRQNKALREMCEAESGRSRRLLQH